MKLEIKGLTKTYLYGKNVFTNLSLTINDGEILSLYGSEGTGKTTLLKCIAGIEKYEGEILFDGQKLPHKPDDVMMLFDDGALFENRTVYDNLAYSLKIRNVEKKQLALKIIEVANIFNLHSILGYKIKSLSLEERKVVTLSRLFMRESKVLLIDDVMFGLPKETRINLWKELSRYLASSNKTIIYSTSDRDEALSIADKIAIMTEYGIKQIASGYEIYHSPASFWALEAVDENAFMVKGMLLDDGVDFLGKKLKCNFTERLISKSYIGKEVLIALHAEDMFFDDNGIESNLKFCKCLGKDYLNVYDNGICLIGEKSPSLVKVLPKVDKIMLFDATNENGILKE